jgi:hypothetical protein
MLARGWLEQTIPLRQTMAERFWFLLESKSRSSKALPPELPPAARAATDALPVSSEDVHVQPANLRNERRSIGSTPRAEHDQIQHSHHLQQMSATAGIVC